MTSNKTLRELAENATPGPWKVISHLNRIYADKDIFIADVSPHIAIRDSEARNAKFIAAANPATILKLLDERDRLVEHIDAVKAADIVTMKLERERLVRLLKAYRANRHFSGVLNILELEDALKDCADIEPEEG